MGDWSIAERCEMARMSDSFVLPRAPELIGATYVWALWNGNERRKLVVKPQPNGSASYAMIREGVGTGSVVEAGLIMTGDEFCALETRYRQWCGAVTSAHPHPCCQHSSTETVNVRDNRTRKRCVDCGHEWEEVREC